MARRFAAHAGHGPHGLAGTALALAFLAAALTGCSGDDSGGGSKGAEAGASSAASPTASSGEPTGAESSPKPVERSTDPAMQPGIKGARQALQAFLRGQAAGDPAVCRYVAPGGKFVRGDALKGNCERGVRNTPHLVRPAEREALRTVTVKGGRIVGEEAVIPFNALHWTSGSMVASTLQDKFVLRRENQLWQIVR
ncbi:hypothetical protein [Actinomadura chibensis]|uniref:Uncharacterized protein n=1 Tax=Actinomadura chibensis TaxID=392828 RepID=A0A5D0NGJ4_9ACTN|nr:hypothetical protein [Actinomadura chibensis]TYB43321.1 hypothetical protein FXF69_26180 [Actinomadura chibensis]